MRHSSSVSRRQFAKVAGAGAILGISAPRIVRAQAKELRIFAWEGYAEPEWVDQFKQATGAGVSIVYASSVDEMFAKMQGSKGADFDVVIFDTSLFQRYLDGGLLHPMDYGKMPNAANLAPAFQKVDAVIKDGKTYGAPFAWGSLPLIYDTETFKTAPESWEVMWDPQYAQQVIAVDDANNSIVLGALVLGMDDPYHLSDAQFADVKAKLISLKGQLLTYYAGFDDGVSIYGQNNIKLMFSMGELQLNALKDKGAKAALTIPKEGAIGWLDCWVISTGVKDADLAHAYINECMAKPIGGVITTKAGYGNTTDLAANEAAGLTYAGQLSWLQASESYEKRLSVWNEVKAS